MHAAPSHAVQAVPNVTPMIDVMLVLLVIFMVTAPAMLDGVRATPPAAENSQNRPEQQEDQVLGIDGTGAFYLNKRRIEKGFLPAALRTIYSARTTDHILYVRADKSLHYGIVLDALDVAAKNGVAVVGMISERPIRDRRLDATEGRP